MPDQTMTLQSITEKLLGNASHIDQRLYLDLGYCTIALKSNSKPLVERLERYFAHILTRPQQTDLVVTAIDAEIIELSEAISGRFTDWKRETGKSGRKDAYLDFPEGRLIRKVRTGMLFLQSIEHRIAVGPCLKNDNQIVNFINAQYMGWLQQRGWLTCHASALVIDHHALAIAGFSGGGKSTLMLQAMEKPEAQFLTNDRLMLTKERGLTLAAGIPKQPRINPGTILHNLRLHPLIHQDRRAELAALPEKTLWHLEEKYDAMIEALYGEGRIATQAPLNAFLVLNWDRESKQPLRLNEIHLRERPELLAAIMKSPGPFFQVDSNQFFQAGTPFDEEAYLEALEGVRIFEATGKPDFAKMSEQYMSAVLNS